jgi:SAM-dependent methyltransferase
MSDNAKQREYWNGPVAQCWAERQDKRERCFAAVTAAALDFARLAPGMNVLDVGCGAGATTLSIAQTVAPGKAVGIDLSTALLAAARAKPGTAQFLEADAAEYPFAPDFDLVFSRFGVMFFADPVAAFAHLKAALRPGGRLAFVCWCPLQDVPFHREAFFAARDLFPPQEPPIPHAPGPFGLADRDYTRGILERSGWRNIRIQRLETQALLGASLDEAVEEAMNLGPLAHASRGLDEGLRDRIRARIRPALAQHATEEGIALAAPCWLVDASA